MITIALVAWLAPIPVIGTAAPALLQGQHINEWEILPSDKPGACLATSGSSDTTLGMMIQSDGKDSSIMMTDPNWSTPQPTYRGSISFDGWATSTDVEFFTITKDGGQAMITAEMPSDVPVNFKGHDMLFVRVSRLGFDDSFNITEGAKIWAALQSCAAGKKSR